ncbi:XRE family transcriptional regulator [Candidatus Formimonas warabiya]|uniref:XRE family transcriptional regulator n=1 Tax=Formimonas warabiya TaxID=1761012 RepID=UPI0011D0F2D0|nr:XRE family transcriptional regulator [Candidatus Formimonas warabiya]
MLRINASRFTEIRIVRGYTIKALAHELNISHQAISQHEKGRAKPSLCVLEKLIRLMNIPGSFLGKEDLSTYDRSAPLFFSPLKPGQQGGKELARILVKWAYELVHEMEGTSESLAKDINLPDFPPDTDVDAKTGLLRRYWGLGLGPIDDLTAVLETNGFYVLNMNLDRLEVDAYSQMQNGHPFVVVNRHRGSALKGRFALARELGHIVLHRHSGPEEWADDERRWEMESKARRFAGSFLLPEDSFRHKMIRTKPDYFLTVKKEWKVPLGVLLDRCVQLNRLDAERAARLQKQIWQKKWRLAGPLDEAFIWEKPAGMRKALEYIVSDRKRGEDFLNRARFALADIEALCALDAHFFSSFGLPGGMGTQEIQDYV